MDLVSIAIVVVIVGAVLLAQNKLLPIQQPIQTFLNWSVCAVLFVFVVVKSGLLDYLHRAFS